MRVLNQVRTFPGIWITMRQFQYIGYLDMIERLKQRNLYKLAWTIATHLQLSEQYPKLKAEILSAWAQNMVREATAENNEVTNTKYFK